ncbi:condensation domain-containing protein, partial [Xanthomonas sacchari]
MNNAVGEEALQLPGLTAKKVEMAHGSAHFDLDLSFIDSGKGLTGKLIYSTSLFDHETICRFNAYLVAILNAMVADDTQPVSRLPLL